jgi:tRNA (guanine37-N1)-methyltransferase
MRFDIITLFPDIFDALNSGITGRALTQKLIDIKCWNPRDFTIDPNKRIDDRPYGGGPGMVMMVEPILKAVRSLKKRAPEAKVLLLSPQGKTFTQEDAWRFSKQTHLIFLCGHYEGVDERIRQLVADYEISVGDFVTTGGELPAMCIIDSIVRLVPGVVGNQESVQQESFQNGLLDYPHYTRPRVFLGCEVPKVLLSGDHKKVTRWRKEQAHLRTFERRPDLLKSDKGMHQKDLRKQSASESN